MERKKEPMTPNGKKWILWLTFMGALILLAGGITMAYSLYTELEASLQEVKVAHAAERGKTQRLTQKVDESLKAIKGAQKREQALNQSRRDSEQEKQRLQSKAAKLKTSIQQLQGAYAAEQAQTQKLAQAARDLLQVVERAQDQMKVLNDNLQASKKKNDKLKSKGSKLKTAVKQLQTVYASEQARTQQLTRVAENLSKENIKAQDIVENLQEREKGIMAMNNKRINFEEAQKNWGKGFRLAIRRMFY